jgi:glutaredoxin-like protein
MPLIGQSDIEPLEKRLTRTLEGPVNVDVFIEPAPVIIVPDREPCFMCDETRQLMEEVAALSDHITLDVHDVTAEADLAREMSVEHVPTVVLRGATHGGVRYVGIPSGYEFATLLEDLAVASHGRTNLRDETREALRTLDAPVHIRVFVTPTCPYCPRVAKIAHDMAAESAHVTADVIEISEFPDLAERYGVQGVPKVVINDRVEFVGAQPEAAFLEALLSAVPEMASKA